MLPTTRPTPRLVLLTLVTALVLTVVAPVPSAEAAGRDIYVATSGDNSNPGTRAEPYRTIQWGVARATAGDTVYVRGGTYREGAGSAADSGTARNPITLRNHPGEYVLVKGALRFTDADWWVIDGINVTWDGSRAGSLVAFNGGSNWVLRNSEIWGGKGTAQLLVQPSDRGPSENFVVTRNCIHGAADVGRLGTEHNIYLFPGLAGDGGRITRNILFDAPNGANIKIGGPGDGRGPARLGIRYNTMARSPSSIIFYRDGGANVVERNLVVDHTPGDRTYRAAVISILTKGRTSHVRDNAWDDHPSGWRDYGTVGDSIRVSGHRQVSTGFDRTRSCDGYRPTNATARLYGRYAKTQPLPDLPPSFGDIAGSVFADDVRWLARRGITSGCNPPTNDRFCPNGKVTRGEMAAFLARALDLPASRRDAFRDDNRSVFERDIQSLAAAGITDGCNPPANDRYCPSARVTRGAMAAFLARALA